MTTLPLTQPPLPPALPTWNPLGHVWMFRNDPLRLLSEVRTQCGEIGRARMGNIWMNVISSPEGVQRVLVEGAAHYSKRTRGMVLLRMVLGQGLLTSEGAFWKRQRRIAQPAFHPQKIAHLVGVMERAGQAMVGELTLSCRQGPVDVAHAMNRVALRIAGETLFSMDITAESSEIGQALDGVLGGFLINLTNPIARYLPLPSTRRFRQGIADLDRVVRGIIARRRAEGEEHSDLLGMFMGAVDEETGEKMSDEHLRDEILTMLLAGHETTANALAWTLYRLARHPEYQDGISERLDSVFKESLRLHPPAWILARRAEQQDVVGGFLIPKDGFVFVSPYIVHRHPDFWPDPGKFDPSRFEGQAAKERNRFSWIPFGAGPRRCIGEHFAMVEGRLLLGMLTENFRFSEVPGEVVVAEPSVTLRPKGGLRLGLSPR